MNLSSWMILVFLLSAGTSLADVDVNWLTGVVGALRKEYRIDKQFCLAANIADPAQIFKNNPYHGKVENVLNNNQVYQGSNVIVAKRLDGRKPVHAEARVLDYRHLEKLIEDKFNFLLIYSYLSPCGDKCANPEHKYNIIDQIRDNVIPNWNNFAFVFTTVFDDPEHGSPPTKEDLREALKQLGKSGLGLDHIFRCYEPTTENKKEKLQCHSCSSGGGVSEVCVEQKGGSSQETEKRGREGSSSEGGATSSKRGRPGSQEPSSSRRSQSRGRSSRRSSSPSSRRSSSPSYSRSSSLSNRRSSRRRSSSRRSSRRRSSSRRSSSSRSSSPSSRRSSSPSNRRSRDRQRSRGNSRSSSRKSTRFYGLM